MKIPLRTSLVFFSLLASALRAQTPQPIDRQAVVARHAISVTAADPNGAMAVGNGEFAFNFDITGLQTFPEYYEKTMPLGILSTWGWHSFPNPQNFTLDTFQMTVIPKFDRTFVFPSASTSEPPPDAAYLRGNPHRFGLARIGLEMTHADGSKVAITDLKSVSQKLDLWTGVVTSTFEVDQTPVKVITAAHGGRDEVATIINSPLIAAGRLKLRIAFPYASNAFGPDYQDWTKPDAHTTTLTRREDAPYLGADFARTLDGTHYMVRTATRLAPGLKLTETAKHSFLIESKGETIEFSACFSPKDKDAEPDTPLPVLKASADGWKDYWTKGGIIDLSGNDDPRAAELERRIVLSQYVMRVHDGGSTPPQETGLGANSWFGKYHMEMYWWHSAQWALWGRADILEKSLVTLNGMMPPGQAMAKREGAKGVKWSKMTDPSGVESPSGVGPALVWQQPHPIYLAELVYRAHKPIRGTMQVNASGGRSDAGIISDNGSKEVLNRYKDIVFQTADYIATFVDYDPARKQYVLGPGVGTADEKHTDYAHNLNPTLELGYWKWALGVARQWRQRLGMPPDETWDKVYNNLAPLTIRNGVYPAVELPQETSAAGMATFLGAALPTSVYDVDAMRGTLRSTTRNAATPQTAITWGTSMWAMCAARLGEPDLAMQLLVGTYPAGQNPFRPSGYTVRRPEQTPMYFPANGGWLSAVAMMSAGWDGNSQPNPGFPKGWKVRWEGLSPMP